MKRLLIFRRCFLSVIIYPKTKTIKNSVNMKKHISENGKKLNKKQLRTIAGGVKLCKSGGVCVQHGPTCYEPDCRTDQGGSIKCADIVNNCVMYSIECIEPKCRFEIPM